MVEIPVREDTNQGVGGNDQLSMNLKQGYHWMIRNIISDPSTFGGKTLNFEESVLNSRNTTSYLDVICPNCNIPNLRIEYKSGPTSISSKTIKEQFIERDLFTATSLQQIQWRLTSTGFNKASFESMLKENKDAINQIINGTNVDASTKFKNWFGLSPIQSAVSDTQIENFVNSNYSQIFK